MGCALQLGLMVLAASVPSTGATARVPAAVGLSLTAQPLNGTAPFYVEFRATVTPGSLSATFEWSFGDGATYQEVATGYSEVGHSYLSAGTYATTVFVQSSSGNANASITVRAAPGTLSDPITATPSSGPAPLTVHFVGVISGGTGVYTAFAWRFGDGGNGSGTDLAYTYTLPGRYTASLTVVDSAGRNATSTVAVDVTPNESAAPAVGGSGVSPYVAAALPTAAALAGVAVLAVAFRARSLRRAARLDPTAAADVEGAPSATSAAVGVPPSPETMADEGQPRPGQDDSARLSERILVHLYWYGRPTSDGVVPADASQAGMARRLGVAQNALSKSLRRLIDAGAVRVELRHVSGASRRLKTYFLTPRGEAVARTMRAEHERHGRG